MDVVVRGRHLDLSQRFRVHTEDKLSRVEKFGVPLTRIDVEVSKESNPRLADRAFEVELTCRGKGPVIRAEASAQDKYAALDLAYARLEERLRRAADKRRAGRRSPALATAGAPGAPVEVVAEEDVLDEEPLPEGVVYAEGPVLVREKTHEGGPMTVEQALHALELVGHDFYLFTDAATGQPSVVYRRRGYDYGLIRLAADSA